MRRHLCLLLCLASPYFIHAQKTGLSLIDSLVSELAKARQDTDRINLLERVSFVYSNINPKKGLEYGHNALQLSGQIKYQIGTAISYIDIGANHLALSAYDSALYYYQRAITVYERLKDRRGIAAAYSNISIVYQKKGNYPQALEYAFKAVDLHEKTGDKYNKGGTFENIGIIYTRQKNYAKTIEYYAKAFNIYKELGDRRAMARNLGNTGIVYDAYGYYDKALANHEQALELNKALGNMNGAQINLANIGYVYSHKKQYDKALEYQKKALKMTLETGDKANIAINSGNIGETYFTLASESGGDAKRRYLEEAITHLTGAVDICRQIGYTGPLAEFSQYLSDAYRLSGDYKAGYDYYKLYRDVNDSLHSTENKIKIAELETRREIEVRERDILLKDKQIEITRLQLEQKRNERFLFIVSIISLLLGMIVIFGALQRYRRSYMKLKGEKAEHLRMIEEQMKRIKLQTDVLREISHMQAHDVRGPVASILGLVQLFNFEDYADPINKAVIDGISTATEKLDAAVQEVIKRENEHR